MAAAVSSRLPPYSSPLTATALPAGMSSCLRLQLPITARALRTCKGVLLPFLQTNCFHLPRFSAPPRHRLSSTLSIGASLNSVGDSHGSTSTEREKESYSTSSAGEPLRDNATTDTTTSDLSSSTENDTAERDVSAEVVLSSDTAIELGGGTESLTWDGRFPVPWGWKELVGGMTGWLVSFVGTGVIVQLLCVCVGWRPWLYSSSMGRVGSPDDMALFLLLTQAARTAAGLMVIWLIVRQFEPLPNQLFNFELKRPFDLQRGWLLWAAVGFIAAFAAVEASALVTSTLADGVEPPREGADALVQVMPIIAASSLSTTSLIIVAGIFAPILEEVVFRGFLMTTLTKWMPVPAAVLISAAAFAAAHLTPSEFPKLMALGIVLGFTYARTRNLLSPMIIHGLWNSGVLIILTLLRLEGVDIQELIFINAEILSILNQNLVK